MKYIENKLGRQLILILVIIFDIVLVTVGIILPKSLTPVYESSIYNALKNPLDIINSDLEGSNVSNEIAYLYMVDGKIYTSNNYTKIVNIDKDELLNMLNKEYGSFEFNDKTYYYYLSKDENATKVAIANENYLSKIHGNLMVTVISLFLIAFLLIALIVFVWSNVVVRKIEKLKLKIDNIENDNFDHKINFKTDDEIKSLAKSIEDMRISLKKQEEYKNNMYQNISHDFKTPLTVIKSYVEAVEDGVEDKDTALNVIKEQTDKLEKKVYSLLYLNKLDYLKDKKNETISVIDISEVINASIEKFKYQRKDVKIHASIDNSKFSGTFDLWETIIDNILNNFIRYAKKEIKITVKNNKLTLFNDGPNIDEKLVNDIFNPFKKGINGQFGLGLSIVKKTLNLLNYDISIENSRKGVSFIIKKGTKK